MPLLLGSAAVASLQALTRCRIARFDAHDFREVILSSPVLSAAVMRAMAARRTLGPTRGGRAYGRNHRHRAALGRAMP